MRSSRCSERRCRRSRRAERRRVAGGSYRRDSTDPPAVRTRSVNHTACRPRLSAMARSGKYPRMAHGKRSGAQNPPNLVLESSRTARRPRRPGAPGRRRGRTRRSRRERRSRAGLCRTRCAPYSRMGGWARRSHTGKAKCPLCGRSASSGDGTRTEWPGTVRARAPAQPGQSAIGSKTASRRLPETRFARCGRGRARPAVAGAHSSGGATRTRSAGWRSGVQPVLLRAFALSSGQDQEPRRHRRRRGAGAGRRSRREPHTGRRVLGWT